MRLTGYTTQEGTVTETKGDTIWLTRDGKDFPVITGSGTEQVRPGDQVRVLLSPKGVVLRVFNRNTDLVFTQRVGKSDPHEVHRDALRAAFYLGFPAVGMFLGIFVVFIMLHYFLFEEMPWALRRRGLRILAGTTFSYFIPWAIAGAIMGAFGEKGLPMLAILILFLLGPGIMVYRGVKQFHALEIEFADTLTRIVREG